MPEGRLSCRRLDCLYGRPAGCGRQGRFYDHNRLSRFRAGILHQNDYDSESRSKGVDFVRCYAEGGNKVSMEDFRVTRTNIVFHLNAAFEAELLRSELPR